MSRASLDWSDPVAVSEWLSGLRVSFDDADGITLDMLRRPRLRELGPALHVQKYGEARAQILAALDYATPPEADDGEPNGGNAGGEHGGLQ